MLESSAARRVQEEDQALQAFVRHHFHQDVTLPEQCDLVVNTATLSIPETVATIAAAYRTHFGSFAK